MTKQTNTGRDTRALKSNGFTCTFKGESIRRWVQTLHGDHTMTVHLDYTPFDGIIERPYVLTVCADGYTVVYTDAKSLRGLAADAMTQAVDAWSEYYITANDLALITNMFK